MRLPALERPQGFLQSLRFFLMRGLFGQVPGPTLALSHRRDFCGKHLTRCFQEGMRQAREWSVAEIEIFAAFVSTLNRCRF